MMGAEKVDLPEDLRHVLKDRFDWFNEKETKKVDSSRKISKERK
jgi:hypothetical protein